MAHLLFRWHDLSDLPGVPFEEIGHWDYLKKRFQFWVWRKHRTMGRPILMLWRKPKPINKDKAEPNE